TGNSLKAAREEAAKLATQFSATNRPTAAAGRLLAVTGNSLKAAREEAAKLATQFSATNRPTAAAGRLL
ncbi:hypothetical protein V5H42_25940, partial [Salmonella enterica]